jgi:hypothetical protein
MTERVTNNQTENDLMGQIHEGMEVFDSAEHKVGKVDSLFMGARADADMGGGEPAVGTGPETTANTSLLAEAAGAFDDGLPQALRSRLRHNGYIRVRGGFLKGDRFALREHIAAVAGDRVILNIRGEELISG